MTERGIPVLPCVDIDVLEPFFTALGFRVTYCALAHIAGSLTAKD